MLKSLQFDGAPVLVTGAGVGIGRSCCETLAELGATVLFCARTEARLQETEAAVKAKGAKAEYFVCDVANEAAVNEMGRKIAAKYGKLKALINNAGTNFPSSIGELAPEKWHEIIAQDLHSMFYVTKAVMPLIEAWGPGANILNVASTFGVFGFPRTAPYAAAKGGMISISRQMAVDYGPKGIRVNALCPGPTLSPRVKGYMDSGRFDRKQTVDMVPLGRMAECEEVANVAIFMVSDAASYMNGSVVTVDGGQTVK